MSTVKRSIPQNDKLEIYRGNIGLDLMNAIGQDSRLRPFMHEGMIHVSAVSLMEVFGDEDKTTPIRVKWNRTKKHLSKRKPELLQKMIQLKVTAEDGKQRLTDVVDLETAFRILFYMDTPASDEFKDMAAGALSRYSEAQIRYRALNISKGMEGSADAIHFQMIDTGLKSDDPDENAENPTYKD